MNTAQTLLIPFEEYETNVLSQINLKFNALKSKVKNTSIWNILPDSNTTQWIEQNTMLKLQSNIGFNEECCTLIENSKRTYTIGLIDADLLDNGTRHPNLALLKMSAYCKGFNHDVRLLCSYDEIEIKGNGYTNYDLIVLSRVFNFTKIHPIVQKLIE